MKKIFSVFLCLCMFFGLFAQNVKSTGLTDFDVKNFAKNFPKIEAEFNRLDVEFAGDIGFSDVKAYAKASEVLKKFGISGDNVCEKINMICLCFGVATIDRSMADLDAESKAILKAMGRDPVAEYRNLINDKDYKIVEKNYDALAKVFGENDTDSYSNSLGYNDDYQDAMNFDYESMLSNLTGASSPKSVDIKKLKADYESEVKVFNGYLSKFDASSKKDIGFIYKKYDKSHASQYKLESKNSSDNYMSADTGHTFQSYSQKLAGTQAEVYFQMNTIGARISYRFDEDDACDSNESTKTVVDKWDIYSCDSGKEIVYYLTDGRTVHVWLDNYSDKAILETDSIKLEGVYLYSPC